MLSFESDYIEGAHEKILQKLIETNMEQMSGYGNDPYTLRAKEKIKTACGCENAEVFFLAGGTQTNAIVISAMLEEYEGVVSAQSGHINTHEAGAIEYTGHKVMELPQHLGKIDAGELQAFVQAFYADQNHEHMVFPGMVYISHPTEYGTLYTRDEIEAIAAVCSRHRLPLFMDGARLGYGLAADETDVDLPLIAKCCDVFYIGGTKVGALCGEALVFTRGNAPRHFAGTMKRHGALMAKGRLLGIQFDTLFTDDLYVSISRHAIEMAKVLKEGLRQKGYRFLIDSPTNQQFIVLENAQMQALGDKVAFAFWEAVDDGHTAVRFATSWATKRGDVERLLGLL